MGHRAAIQRAITTPMSADRTPKPEPFIPEPEPEPEFKPTPAVALVCPQCNGPIPAYRMAEPFCSKQHRLDFNMETERLRQRQAELASALEEVREQLKGRL